MPADPQLLLLWSESMLVSMLVWALISILALYLARRPVHELLDRLCQAISGILRFGASILLSYTRRTAGRNRDILRAAAEDAASRKLERQLRRISAQVDHDLDQYPALHRTLLEQVGRINNDYRHAGDTPPTPPAWLNAVETVANINVGGDPALARILSDMHTTLETSCHDTLLEYRAANQRRFNALRRMQPYFRRITATLEQLQQRLERVRALAGAIDEHMATFEALRTGRRDSVRRLRFELHLRATSGLALLAVAGFAALLNHLLIAEPLNTLLGMNSDTVSWVATAALMLIALGLGVWITEVTGLTRLLGLVWQFDERQRRHLAGTGIALLVTLALLQAMLVWSAYAVVEFPNEQGVAWPAPAAAALLAAMLPFVLALAAVPLEMVLHSAAALQSGLLARTAQLGATLLRLVATAVSLLPAPLKKIYDLWIFLPLWCERAIQATRSRTAEAEIPTSLPPSQSGEDSKS